MVVAGKEQDAAMGRRAGGVAMLEDVTRAVDPRSLAVPHGEDAVVFGIREQADLLRAPHRGGAEILVDAGLELDVVLIEEALRAPQPLIEATKRRAAIARDEARRVEAGSQVAGALHHRQARQGPGPSGEESAALCRGFVV